MGPPAAAAPARPLVAAAGAETAAAGAGAAGETASGAGDAVIGVLTVGKPSVTVQPFVEAAKRNLREKGLWLLAAALGACTQEHDPLAERFPLSLAWLAGWHGATFCSCSACRRRCMLPFPRFVGKSGTGGDILDRCRHPANILRLSCDICFGR